MGATIGPIISSSFLREMEIDIANVEATSVNRRNSSLLLFFLSYFQEAQSYCFLPDTWVLIVTKRDITDKRHRLS